LTVTISCSNGHRFPVNLDKHKYRDHVFCPKCRTKVVVRKKHVFSPNPEWQKRKEEDKDLRRRLKTRMPDQLPALIMPAEGMLPGPLAVIAMSIRQKRRRELMEEKENEEIH
jgi:hypothetical protein